MKLKFNNAPLVLIQKTLCCLLFSVSCLSTAQADIWTLVSASGRYNVTIDRQHTVALGEDHRWLFDAKDKNGRSAKIAAVDIKGGMPAHRHGLPNTPSWTLDNQQRLVVESLQFHMPGRWFFELRFRDVHGWDSVRVDFDVDATGEISTGNAQNASASSMLQHDDHFNQHDDHFKWSNKEKAVITSLALPLSSGMSHQLPLNNESLINFGKTLFADKGLSGSGATSCIDCHIADRYFTSDQITHATHQQPPSEEISGHIKRDVMTIVGSGSRLWLNWDGRKGELWSHALLPLEIDEELGNNRTRVARYVSRTYFKQYTEIFGDPSIDAQSRWPTDASPFGDVTEKANWNSLSTDTKHHINSIFVNVGKALAAYQAGIKPAPGAFDQYAHSLNDKDIYGDSISLSAKRGLKLFIGDKGRCINCHNNATFTNNAFERVVMGNATMDLGRTLGAQLYLYDEFNCRSQYSDLNRDQCSKKISKAKTQASNSPPGAFIVPGLRGLEKSAPYMHNGQFDTLESVISHYNTIGDQFGQGDLLPLPGSLSEQDEMDLVAFLLSLGSGYSDSP